MPKKNVAIRRGPYTPQMTVPWEGILRFDLDQGAGSGIPLKVLGDMNVNLEADVLNFLTSFQKRIRAAREIGSLGTNVLDDFGLNRSQLRRLALTPASVMRRMVAMAERHGVSAEALETHGRDRAALAERCARCRKTRECRTYLADQSAGAELAAFCPNHTNFKQFASAAMRTH